MSESTKLRIVTRMSALAMWQANYVRTQLMTQHKELDVEIIGVKTTGDLSQGENIPLAKIGGKGVFVKELEQALLANEADIAVHSLKDVPATFPTGLGLVTFCERASPFDAWICPAGDTIETIKKGAIVGTSSLRRVVQLKKLRPDLNCVPVRGNVDTRLKKCQSGEFDALVLATAGVERLNLHSVIREIFTAIQLLPAVGQGALAIECRVNDHKTQALLKALDHGPTRVCVEAERAMNAALGGNCQVPVAGFATLSGNTLKLTGRVGHPDSLILLESYHEAPMTESVKLGEQVATSLIQQGAMDIIQSLTRN